MTMLEAAAEEYFFKLDDLVEPFYALPRVPMASPRLGE